jgi:hypothetical protein
MVVSVDGFQKSDEKFFGRREKTGSEGKEYL